MADPNVQDDLETKVEDAFIKLVEAELPPEIQNVYPWARQGKEDPSVTVKATRGVSDASTSDGDKIQVDVELMFRHEKSAPRNWFLCLENAVGRIRDLVGNDQSDTGALAQAAGGSLWVFKDAQFTPSTKFKDGEKIVRTLNLMVHVAHRCSDQ